MNKQILWMFAAVGAGVLIWLLAPILTPFVTAFILAYITNPVARWMVARRVPRSLAALAVFVLIGVIGTVLVLIVVPALEREAVDFMRRLPGYLDRAEAMFQSATAWVAGAGGPVLDLDTVKRQLETHSKDLGGFAAAFVAWLTKSGIRIIAFFASVGVTLVVTFYLLRDWDIVLKRLLGLFPVRSRRPISEFAREADTVLAAFLRGQLLVMFLLACIYSVGLAIAGLDLAIPVGVVSGLVSFVPYLGFLTGSVLAVLAALLQGGDVWLYGGVAIAFTVGQVLESFLLTPVLVGDRIGLHPVTVIFAIMAGGQLFGFVGVLLALPVAAVSMVAARQLRRRLLEGAGPS